jgi:hypothetical protein
MKYCPLMSYAKQYSNEIPCMGKSCGFADEAGDCLVQQALQCYVAKERTRVAETEAAREHFEMLHKNGMRTPIDFKQYTKNSIEIDPKEWENLQKGE